MRVLCDSRISQVVVHARGALVRRAVTLPPEIGDGEVDLVVRGVTPLAEGGSVRAALPDAAKERLVVSVETAIEVPETPAAVGVSVERVRDLTARIERLEAEREHLTARREALVELVPDPMLPSAWRTGQVEARVADALAGAALAAELATEIDARLLAIGEEWRVLEEERQAAALADAQAATSERVGTGHPTRTITVRLAGKGAPGSLDLHYIVPGARWWPLYTLRLADGGRSAAWWMEALVAQRSGEDWTGVAIEVSTADLLRDARLPELPSLRLGRTQAPVARGYRPVPEGLDPMFAAYDRAFPWGTTWRAPPPPPRPAIQPSKAKGAPGDDDDKRGGFDAEDLEAELDAPASMSFPEDAILAAPASEIAYPSSAAYAPQAKRAGAPRGKKSRSMIPSMGAMRATPPPAPPSGGSFGGGVGAAANRAVLPVPEEAPSAIQPTEALLDFDALRLAAADDRGRRGRLVPGEERGVAGDRDEAARAVDAIAPLPRLCDPQTSRGRFDHRFRAAGLAEVPSDGQSHRVMLGTAEAPSVMRWTTVPREAAEVYREAELRNPFAAPLLAGPVDVYFEGSLLLQTAIEHIDKGGTLRVGLGVEDRIRVARNARAVEESAGLLGGSIAVSHGVTIDLTSSLAAPAEVEVLERVPVTDDSRIKIDHVATTPQAAEYTQAERGAPVRGGLLWKVGLAAAGKATVKLGYRITFPSKSEIVGGNRRE